MTAMTTSNPTRARSSRSFPWLGWGVILLTLATAAACRRDNPRERKRDPAVLDGMELNARRRISLESAADAMRRGDLNRLEMLSIWVRTRAQVVLFEPADIESLDRAITCLKDGSTRSAELTALARLKSGTLLQPARDACRREPE